MSGLTSSVATTALVWKLYCVDPFPGIGCPIWIRWPTELLLVPGRVADSVLNATVPDWDDRIDVILNLWAWSIETFLVWFVIFLVVNGIGKVVLRRIRRSRETVTK